MQKYFLHRYLEDFTKYEKDWDAKAIEDRAKKLADECYLNVFVIGEASNFPKISDNYLEKFK